MIDLDEEEEDVWDEEYEDEQWFEDNDEGW